MEGGNDSIVPFIAFFIGIFILALVTAEPDGEIRPLFSVENEGEGETFEERPERQRSVFISTPQEEPEPLDRREVERDIKRALRELDSLREEARTARIWGDISQYEGMVTLQRGNVRTDEPENEYLRLSARSNNNTAINISGWLLESYVTEEGATIPFGTRIYKRGRVNETEAIMLEPGERAYVVTDESPLGVSFHETQCTGYLREFQDFVPTLSRSCPRPEDELELFGKVDFGNDACFEFVEDIRRCEVPNEEEVDAFRTIEEIDEEDRDDDDEEFEEIPLSGACKQFIRDNLDYTGCLNNHQNDPFFVDGEWYIYLGRTDELWKDDREIIRLIDREGRTVDVIEY